MENQMLNVFRSFLTITLLICSTACASSSSSEDESLIAHRFRVKGHDFSSRVEEVCSNPMVVSLDFSSVKLSNEDLEIVFNALVEREKRLAGIPHCTIELIDLRRGTFDETGFLMFLGHLQHGKKEGGKDIYPDVRETVLKIGLSLNDDFIEQMEKAAPSTFAGGLQIIQ